MKGVTITDHRKKHRKEADREPPVKVHTVFVDGKPKKIYGTDSAERLPAIQAPEYTQKQLMDMVAKRFRPGPKRFLVVEDRPIKKVGSIEIPETAQRPTTSGRVCIVGTNADLQEAVKVGDHVIYAIFGGILLPLRREERVRALELSEIMCWVNDAAPATLTMEGEVQ